MIKSISQLGVQAHSLRFSIAERGLDITLSEVAGRGIGIIELVSFPGCRGNRWGDFGAATDLAPDLIARAIHRAGLVCPSTHVTAKELAEPHRRSTLDWAAEIGIKTIVLSSLPPQDGDGIDGRVAQFKSLNGIGRRLGDEGFRFALHTQADLWKPAGPTCAADELPHLIDPAFCKLQFDPSGAIIHGIDPAAYIASHPEHIFALHLRDGVAPSEPMIYLPALPLGEGSVDWRTLLEAAAASAAEFYFLEMEVDRPADPIAAIDISLQFLKRFSLV